MAKTSKIETPGDNESSDQIKKAQTQVEAIQAKATNIADAIALNQSIIDDPNSLDDEKEQAQLKIDALLAAQNEIDSILGDAQTSLTAIKAQVQDKATKAKKTDMSNITINKSQTKIVTGPNITLTAAGYVIKPRGTKGVKE